MNKKLIPVIVLAVLLPIVGVVGFSIQDDIGNSMESYDDISVNNDEVNYGRIISSSEEDGKIMSYVHGIHGNESPIQLVELADLIFLGDVKSVNIVEEPHNSGARYNMVFSYTEIEPTEILKGTPILNENGNIVLRIPGGETDDYMTESEYLKLYEDDRVFLYLGESEVHISKYIPVGEQLMFVVRDNEAMNYDGELVNTTELLDEHKALIESLE